MKHLILYHANCMDGFAAACVAAKSIHEDAEPAFESIEYRAVQYGSPPPIEDLDDGDVIVYVLDFSYSVEEMCQLANYAKKLWWVDHHADQLRRDVAATFENGACYLEKEADFTFLYDTSLSGATAAWTLLFGDRELMPEVLRYVQDRDLWTWALRHSREVNAALDLHFRGADVADDWRKFLSAEPWEYVPAGTHLLRHQAVRVAAAVKSARPWPHTTIGEASLPEDTVVMVVNSPQDISEVGEALCEAGADLAVMYFQKKSEEWVYSLRSRPSEKWPKGLDCRLVAGPNGGGGHRNAAGFPSTTFIFGKAPKLEQLFEALATLGVSLEVAHTEFVNVAYSALIDELGVATHAANAAELVDNLVEAIELSIDVEDEAKLA